MGEAPCATCNAPMRNIRNRVLESLRLRHLQEMEVTGGMPYDARNVLADTAEATDVERMQKQAQDARNAVAEGGPYKSKSIAKKFTTAISSNEDNMQTERGGGDGHGAVAAGGGGHEKDASSSMPSAPNLSVGDVYDAHV